FESSTAVSSWIGGCRSIRTELRALIHWAFASPIYCFGLCQVYWTSLTPLRGFSSEDWSLRRLVPLHGFIFAPRSWANLTQTSYLPATLYVYRRVRVAVELGTTIRA